MSRARLRRLSDRLAQISSAFLTSLCVALVPIILLALLVRSQALFEVAPLHRLLISLEWRPLRGEFGFLAFVAGTMWVTVLAMVLAVPACMLTAIFLAEYAPRRLRESMKPLIDLLAGIPSVVYGLWGILAVVPFIRAFILPRFGERLAGIPLLRPDNATGYSVLAGGVVLAVMVFPVIISTTEEVIRAVPDGMRQASLALGATRWQTVKGVVLRRAAPGVIAAVVLGFSRAFGETMAVMMVVGNVVQIPRSVFDAGYPLSALIANNYGEMMSIPLYDSALLAAALVLLLVVMAFTLAARIVLLRAVRRAA